MASQCKKCDKKHREEHKEDISECKKQWYKNNREKVLKKRKQYREEHKEDISECKKRHYKNNREKVLKKQKQYHKNNPHISLNASNRRRKKSEEQGNGVTKEQWYEMFCFFNFCCAYSGEYLGNEENKKIRSIDHIVALDNGGLNEIWNCVPMYRSYNTSKHTNDMLDWYTKQSFYSEERLEKIYAWCEYAFDKWKPRRKGNKKYNK